MLIPSIVQLSKGLVTHKSRFEQIVFEKTYAFSAYNQ